ncbi:unnamed protein product [Nezara viridula]|uniref:Uncharacterized protein n=1 Tax=Nezara viridula TaxID=85310 RepID=A0A9P0HL20_NEZVI|nr:unnamed protein product [Nezara viridula]
MDGYDGWIFYISNKSKSYPEVFLSNDWQNSRFQLLTAFSMTAFFFFFGPHIFAIFSFRISKWTFLTFR